MNPNLGSDIGIWLSAGAFLILLGFTVLLAWELVAFCLRRTGRTDVPVVSDKVREQVREHPFPAAVIAVIIGVLLGHWLWH